MDKNDRKFSDIVTSSSRLIIEPNKEKSRLEKEASSQKCTGRVSMEWSNSMPMAWDRQYNKYIDVTIHVLYRVEPLFTKNKNTFKQAP